MLRRVKEKLYYVDIKEEPVLWLLLNCKGSHRYQVRTGDPLGSCYKSVGWLAATTFRLFLDLVAVSVSSFCVGSTDTFLGFPSVTREEAMAMPGNERRWLLWVSQGQAGRRLPGVPGGAWLWPPVGILTIRDSTAALLPAHGSSAIGLGRDFLRLFLQTFGSIETGGGEGGQVDFTWNDDWTLTLESSLVLSRLDQKVYWPFAPFQHKVAVGVDIWMNDSNQHYEYYYW